MCRFPRVFHPLTTVLLAGPNLLCVCVYARARAFSFFLGVGFLFSFCFMAWLPELKQIHVIHCVLQFIFGWQPRILCQLRCAVPSSTTVSKSPCLVGLYQSRRTIASSCWCVFGAHVSKLHQFQAFVGWDAVAGGFIPHPFSMGPSLHCGSQVPFSMGPSIDSWHKHRVPLRGFVQVAVCSSCPHTFYSNVHRVSLQQLDPGTRGRSSLCSFCTLD